MNDRPTAKELIDAVRQYLEAHLLPSLTDARLRFQTLVAANVLAIVGRELPAEEERLREECGLLGRILGEGKGPAAGLGELRSCVTEMNARLCGRIRAGEFDEPGRFRTLAAELRTLVVRKLEVNNPRYLAT
jgi:hypothetical protein